MKKKDGWKEALKIICFVLIVALLFVGFCNVFSFKFYDGVAQMKMFYEQEDNSIDVLTLGSSTSFANINPAVMYREQGLLAYNLGGAIEPMWNTYYRLKEALKTQSPSVLVLDVFRMQETSAYQTNQVTIKNTSGMKLSGDWLESLKASVDPSELMDYLVEPLQYHARYGELSTRDFSSSWEIPDEQAYKGYYMCYGRGNPPLMDQSEVTDIAAINGKTLEYFRKTVELARDNGIAVLLVAAPGANTASVQTVYNAVALLAQEYGIDFLNFNNMYEELELTPEDFADNRHLNYVGSEKYSAYLAKYIADNYAVVDGFASDKRSSWENAVHEYERRVLNYEIASADTISEMLELTRTNAGYYTVINMTYQWRNYEGESILEQLASYGINYDEANYGNAVVLRNGEFIYSSYSAAGKRADYVYHQQVGEHDVIKATGSFDPATGLMTSQMYLNNDEMSMDDERGINVMVYDEQLGCAVAASAFEYNDGSRSAALMMLYSMNL